jgi:hypothetical protein
MTVQSDSLIFERHVGVVGNWNLCRVKCLKLGLNNLCVWLNPIALRVPKRHRSLKW